MKPARVWRIYLLVDPRDGAPRYVGVTHSRARRLREHIYQSKKLNTHAAKWVSLLLKLGLHPLMHLVEAGVGNLWSERERHWIALYRAQGARLTNHTDGGEGCPGRKATPEQRARMSASHRIRYDTLRRQGVSLKRGPHSPERVQRMSAAMRGKKASPETRVKLSKAHSDPSAETRAKLAEAVRRRPESWWQQFAKNRTGTKQTPEHRAKISRARKAAWSRKKKVSS